jgi:uncharacterized protein
MTRALFAALLLVPASSALAQPLADHHQHLFSPALAALISDSPPARPIPPITAADLIRHLDDAGIKRAAVFSTAYIFGQPSRKVENEREKLMADNDWTAAQVAQYPGRLVGFCGISPLKDYALDELARCAKNPNLRHGVKLHLGNAVVDYHDRAHIEQMRRVFGAANGYRMPIVVHMRSSTTAKLPYGRDEATIFFNEILPAAPDVDVQIAHLAGAGGFEVPVGDQALQVFVEALAKNDPRARRLWFDVTTVVTPKTTPERAALIAQRIRELGVQRVLYGSDAPTPDSLPKAGWAAFRTLPLTEAEFLTIANNVPPYMAR